MVRGWAVLKKILSAVVVLWLILTVNFVIFRVWEQQHFLPPKHPYDPLHGLRDRMRIDDPLIIQYFDYVKDTLTGDFYVSYSALEGQEIRSVIFDYVLVTLALFVLTVLVSAWVGTLCARAAFSRKSRLSGRLMHLLALVLVSIPVPLLALLFLAANANLNLGLPLRGGVSYDYPHLSAIEKLGDRIYHTMLPLATCVLSSVAFFFLLARNGMADLSEEERMEGMGKRRRIRRDAVFRAFCQLKPSPHLFLLYVMGTVILVDAVFGYGGLGRLLLLAFRNVDYPLLAIVFFFGSLVLLISDLVLSIFILARMDSTSHESESTSSVAESHEEQNLWGLGVAKRKTDGLLAAVSFLIVGLWREFRKSRAGVASLIVLSIVLILGLLAPVLATVPNPNRIDNREPTVGPDHENPLSPSLSPSPYTGFRHPLGTDVLGRDIYSMTLYGARGPLIWTAVIVLLSIAIGFFVGTIAKVFADIPDRALRVITYPFDIVGEAALAIPTFCLVLSVVLALAIGPGASSALLVLIVYCWAWVMIAEPTRKKLEDQTTSTLAAGAGSLGSWALPTIFGKTLLVTKIAVVVIMPLILSLSFWGAFGLQPNSGDWGLMLGDAYSRGALVYNAWLWILMPLFGVCALVGSTYIIIDTLEGIVMRAQAPRRSRPDLEKPKSMLPAQGLD